MCILVIKINLKKLNIAFYLLIRTLTKVLMLDISY